MQTIRLETTSLRVEFDKQTGSLTSIYSKPSDWYIFNRPHLALSWRLMLPLDNRRNNNAWGHLQSVSPTCDSGTDFVRFHWAGITSEFGGTHNIGITTECRIEKNQIVFQMRLANNDTGIIENAYYPYIGDLHRPADAKKFSIHRGGYWNMDRFEIWPTHTNYVGTHSVDVPTMNFVGDKNPPMHPYLLASDEKGNGLYMGMTERRIEPATWLGEAHPGWENSMDYRLFTEDTAQGRDVFYRFAMGHFPYLAPGEQCDLLPLGLEAYKGDWITGTNCYRRISESWNRLPDMPHWARDPHSWLQIHINSPEDELRIPFKDLPEIARECKAMGVTVIQLVGWNDGGQDRGNPGHDPDPRLGTFDELQNVIREIQSMGIKLILFAKFTWADESHPDFKEVYEPLAIKDPYGNYYAHRGYQYQSLSQMADVNTRRLIPMCFHSDKYMEICREEFRKCLDLGADGILFDENHHHAHTLCCFDRNHGHRYGASTYAADSKLTDMFRAMTKGRDFLICGEATYNFQMNDYDISYARTWGRDHAAGARAARPDATMMTAVIGFNDRAMINQCLLNRYILSYEPFNFKGRLTDFPETVSYGGKMDKLRTEFREYFWDGTFEDKLGGNVEVLESADPFAWYSVYTRSSSDTESSAPQAMVICNYHEDRSITVKPTLLSGQALTHYRLVDDDVAQPFSGEFTIPPASAAIVV